MKCVYLKRQNQQAPGTTYFSRQCAFFRNYTCKYNAETSESQVSFKFLKTVITQQQQADKNEICITEI